MISRIRHILKRLLGNPFLTLQIVLQKVTKYYEEKTIINSLKNPYLEHCNKLWKRSNLFDGPYILCDISDNTEFIISNNYFLQALSEKYNGQIHSFSKKKNFNLSKIRTSQNFSGHIQTKLFDKNLLNKKYQILNNAKETIKSKKHLFDYKLNDIWIGIDIYETYLRYGSPTVNLKDPELWKIFSDAIELIIFWEDFFKRKKINSVLLTHDCYVYYNSIAKVAYKYKKPVYFCSVYCYQKATEPFSLYKDRFINYRNMFNNLPENEKVKGVEIAKKQLKKRLSGEVGVNMKYSTKSAFHKNFKNNVTSISKKIKVLICTHCFFDNPHGYGGMIFLDFFEWLNFLGEISKKTDYDWYIKTHPDYLPGTLETIRKIIRKYPKFKLLPPDTSFHQLAEEKINFALTCFGSVGHELPMLGINVINCAYNPHIAYDFNWHARSKEEYEKILKNLPKLEKKISFEEIYEFFYIHYYYTYVDNLFFNSYNDYVDKVNKENNSRIEGYKYFLSEFNMKYHKKIVSDVNEFLDSNKKNFFLKGPE